MNIINIDKDLFRQLTVSFMRVSAKIEGITFDSKEEFSIWANDQLKGRTDIMKGAFMLAVKHQDNAESKMADNMAFCA